MDILKVGNSNAMLLAVSARLQGNKTPGELSSIIAGIIYDVEETGKLTDKSLKTGISEGSIYIASKLSDIRINLEYHFGTKTTVDVPNFEDYCDDNGNGIINKWDFDLDFAPEKKAETNTVYISTHRNIRINPATTAVAKTDTGTIVLNGTDTNLSEYPLTDGDKLAVKVLSSPDMETIVEATVAVEFAFVEGDGDGWIVSGKYSVKTVECNNDEIRSFVCGDDNSGTKFQKCEERKWSWVNNGNCTRIYNCSAKPENAKWNMVDKYTQTWDETKWTPADSVTQHSFVAGNNSCFFSCNKGYGWNGNECFVSGCKEKFPYYYKGYCWSDTAPTAITWNDALSYCNGLGGRLPNIRELRMLLQNCPETEYPQMDGLTDWCQVTDTCIDSSCRNDACSGCPVDYSGKYNVFGETGTFCSSTNYIDGANHIWTASFIYSNIGYGNKSGGHRVICIE